MPWPYRSNTWRVEWEGMVCSQEGRADTSCVKTVVFPQQDLESGPKFPQANGNVLRWITVLKHVTLGSMVSYKQWYDATNNVWLYVV